MRKIRARLGSILLALAMLLSLLPVTALAADNSVAKIGNTEYTTLQDAFDNADGDTVTLLTDVYLTESVNISASKTVIFDLNGKNITVYKDESAGRSLYAINNYGTFTLMDSVGGGTITARGIQNLDSGIMTIESGKIISCDSNGGASIWNEATLTVNGGTFETVYVGSANDSYGVGCLNNQGTALITGGTFTDVNRRTYAIISTGRIEITPSEGKKVIVNGAHGALAVDSGAAVVNGGSYNSTDYYGLYVSNDGMGQDPMTAAVTVNGGTFSGKSYSVWIGSDYNNPVNSSIAIYGGTFNQPINAQENTREGALVVYSGTFANKIEDQYLAAGHAIVQRGDQWVVGSLDDLAVAQVGEKKYTDLKSAMDAAQDGETVTLLNDSIGNQQIIITDGRNLTLDMNGYDVGFAFKQNISIYHGGLNIIGSGKLYEEAPWFAPVMLYGSDTDLADYSTVTIGKNVTLEGWAGLFIDQHDEHGATAYGIKATVYGTLHSVKDTSGAGGHALYINGTIKATEGNVPHITLDGATLNTDLGNGMYLAGYAKTIINNSIIDSSSEDSTGIEIRAGELTINGDTVVKGGTGATDISPNGNGSTTNNVALAVIQHTTKLPTLVTINDGIFIGGAALFEQNAQNNDQEAVSKISLAVNGGSFNGQFYSENKTGFITGGVFSSDPSAYLASGYAAVDNSGDTVYQYKVVQAGQNPAQVVTGEADVSVSGSITNADEEALAGEVVSALNNSNEKPDIGEALKAAAGTVANQNTVTKEQGKDALTNAGVSVTDTSNVTIVVQPYLEISVAAVSIQSSTKTVTLDITPMYITVATTNKDNIDLEGSNKNAVQIGTAHELTITKPVTVTIPLTTGFVNDGTLYVKHVKDNGSTYYYKGSVKNNVLTFTNPNGFSLFTYSTSSDEVVAAIGDHGYATLADAIAAVEKGGTIELLADNLSATVSREISFTVTGNGADTVRLSAGSGYKMQQVGNTYTFTYIGTEGGGSSTSGYLVSVDSGKNGKVTVSPQRAEKGETVTITVKPDEGYELDELTVTDKNGDSVKVTYQDDNKYTFKMPGSSVTVEATFQAVKEESPVDAFLDINTGAWYYDAVKYVVENGLMSGTGTYTFAPNTTLSRGMIAQMLYALEGKPSVSATNSFTDVSANDWYAKAASWTQSKGIITGYDDGRFAPNDPLTREQLALILYNYAQLKGYDTSAKADLSKYVDGSSTSAWAQTAMTWAVGEGLLSGRGLNMLYPTGTATRAEVAQIMMNFCENTAK